MNKEDFINAILESRVYNANTGETDKVYKKLKLNKNKIIAIAEDKSVFLDFSLELIFGDTAHNLVLDN